MEQCICRRGDGQSVSDDGSTQIVPSLNDDSRKLSSVEMSLRMALYVIFLLVVGVVFVGDWSTSDFGAEFCVW